MKKTIFSAIILAAASFACNAQAQQKVMLNKGDQTVETVKLGADQWAVLEVAVDADALTQPLCHDLLVGHVDELVLEGGAACVDNKNFQEYCLQIKYLLANKLVTDILYIL